MTENHKKNAENLTKIIAQTTFIFATGSVFFGGVNIQPASASTSCSVDGVRGVPGQPEIRIGFRATGKNPSGCESEITNSVYRWCNSFKITGGGYCRGDWSTFRSSGGSNPEPNPSPVSKPPVSQPAKTCPEPNITIKPTSKNLEFKRGQEWNPCSTYKFVFQNDGNLVLYSQNRPIWATGTNNRADLFAVQADGNVVLYGGGRAVWATNTGGNPGAFLAIQSDGNLVVYSRNGNALWSSR